MTNEKINAIFYSNGNIELGFKIKQALWGYKINLQYISNIIDLIYQFQQGQINILFIDCQTVELTKDILKLLKGTKIGQADNVIFINDNENLKINVNKQNHFVISSKNNLINQLKENEQQLKLNLKMGLYNNFDMCYVNNFLTNYLIQLGFYPKYIGFLYIKQCIEEAINNNGILGSLSTQIYPKVAFKNKTNIQNVERNIRNSINCAIRVGNCNDNSLKLMIENSKMTNRIFLSYLLEQIISIHKERIKIKIS